MSERIATCTTCGARYGNIPDTLTARRIRCRKCEGVVEVPPLEEPQEEVVPEVVEAEAGPVAEESEPEPVVEKPEPAPVVPVRRRSGRPRTAIPVDRSVVRKDPAGQEEPKVEKKSGAEILARLQARREAISPPTPETELKERPQEGTAPTESPKEGPKRAHSPTRKVPSRSRRSKKSKSSGRKSRRREAKETPKKKRLPKAGLISIGVLLVLGITAIFLLNQGDESATDSTVQAKDTSESTPETNAVPSAGSATSANSAEPAPVLEIVAAPPPPEEIEEETAPSPSPADVTAQPLPPSREFNPPVAGDAIDYTGITDPLILDLTLVSQLPRWSQSDETTWQEIQDDLELYLDDAGARSNRAGNRLVESGRHAFPALVNAMLNTDWSDPDSVRTCGALNKLIVGMSQAGKNFGWETLAQKEPGSIEYDTALLWDKKVVAIWHNSWISKFSEDDEQWRGFTEKKTKPKPKTEERPPPPSFDDEFDD